MPPFAISKSTVLNRREEEQEQKQAWWLPVAAMPTSIFISFLVWGMSHLEKGITRPNGSCPEIQTSDSSPSV